MRNGELRYVKQELIREIVSSLFSSVSSKDLISTLKFPQ